MNEEQPNAGYEPPVPQQPPTAMEPDEPQPAALPAKEVEEGKLFAILSYALSIIGLPFFLVPLIMRNNEFSLFHAKQNLMIWLVAIVLGVVSAVLSVICIGVVIGIAAIVFLLVLEIMGIINAVDGEMKPLPLIGQVAVDWFKGLQKV